MATISDDGGSSPLPGRDVVRTRLQRLGFELPEHGPVARGAYVPAVVDGDRLHVAALGPFALDGSGGFSHQGVVGGNLSPEDGADAARVTAVNLLAAADSAAGLDRLARLLRLVVYVSTGTGFADHVVVADGASELLRTALGSDRGSHVRTVVGVASLPFELPVVISMDARLTGAAT